MPSTKPDAVLHDLELTFGDIDTVARKRRVAAMAERVARLDRPSSAGYLIHESLLSDDTKSRTYFHFGVTRLPLPKPQKALLVAHAHWVERPVGPAPPWMMKLKANRLTAEWAVSELRNIFPSTFILGEARLEISPWVRPVPIGVPDLRLGSGILENVGVQFRSTEDATHQVSDIRWEELRGKGEGAANVWLKYSFKGPLPSDPIAEESRRCLQFLASLTASS